MISIVDYDLRWPEQFRQLRAELAAVLGDLPLAIEHVGSTAIPGLAAKPVIDIDIVIPSPAELPTAIQRLASIGYEHQGDLGITGRHAFRLLSDEPIRHVYVCVQDSIPLRQHLAFRDYLRQHPATANAYAALKRRLADTSGENRAIYADGKTAFVHDILAKCSH